MVVVDVWDEPPFVPRQGHCSSPHNVDTPETARSHTFTPRTATAHRSAGTAATHRRTSPALTPSPMRIFIEFKTPRPASASFFPFKYPPQR